MILVNDVRAALERIAFSGRIPECRAGLVQLRRALAATTKTDAESQTRDVLNAHLLARNLFEVGADIVTRTRKKGASAQTIEHRLMTYAASQLNVKGRVPVTLIAAVVGKNGKSGFTLEVQDTCALITYAFWIVAPEIEQTTWWRYKTRKCDVCGRTFRHQIQGRGRPRTTCSDECRVKQDRHDRPRKCVVCGKSIKKQPKYMKICPDEKCEREKAHRDMTENTQGRNRK